MTFSSVTEKYIFYYLPIGLFSLIPFLLITGPFLSDLSVSLISLLFVIYCIKERNFSYFNSKFFYFFLLFWIYLLINSFFNNLNIDNFGSTIVYLVGVLWISLCITEYSTSLGSWRSGRRRIDPELRREWGCPRPMSVI